MLYSSPSQKYVLYFLDKKLRFNFIFQHLYFSEIRPYPKMNRLKYYWTPLWVQILDTFTCSSLAFAPKL